MIKKISPSSILNMAIETYLEEEMTIEDLIATEDVELRLKTVAFSIKQLLIRYGEKGINTLVRDKNIYFYKENILIYILCDDMFLNISALYPFLFKLIICWGEILTKLELSGQSEKCNYAQTAIVAAV